MSTDTVDTRLTAAQEAANRHEWQESYALLAELDAEGRLDGAGLELLGSIAWWASEVDKSVAARERAFAKYLEEGDRVRAAFMALMAAWDHHQHQSEALAMGWRSRALRILNDEPESFAHGFQYVLDSFQLTAQGDFNGAADLAARAVDIGARFGDKDLQGYGLVSEGMALVRRGEIEKGLSLLDEATAAAVAGELSPFATGVVYCQTISTCRDLADYRRAGQWTEVAERWCERQAISGFPGICRVHRAEIMSLHGQWTNAIAQAERASKELLLTKSMPQAAEGFYQLGEIRLRIGDFEGAEEGFREADNLGREPEPGRSLLALAQGRVDAASSSIRRALASPWLDALTRARILPAQVEIAIAARNIEVAGKATDELQTIADRFGSAALQAAAHGARGAVCIAMNDADAALDELALARSQWQAVDAPYELARTRTLVAAALRIHGEAEAAVTELEAARASFARLGATPDMLQCDRTLEQLRRPADQVQRERRTFMFTDIVGSTDLISVIGDEAWGDVVRWHDQSLRGVVGAHGGEEVNHAGDGFFFAFGDVRSGVDAAIDIQRTLAEHRRTAGFAPRVRIGLHAAEATKVDEGYLGQGVHAAARVGGIAGGNEIVASAETLEGEGIEGVGPPRDVELKGIPGTVPVQTIEWAAPGA